jgi:hypothetical protein
MLIVYVDESGSPNSASPDPNYPIFVMAACVFEPNQYATRLAPALCALKFHHFGTDAVVLHESEIRKRLGVFSFSNEEGRRQNFLEAVTRIVIDEVTEVIAVATKASNQRGDLTTDSVERLWHLLPERGNHHVHWIFEKRGHKEDAAVSSTLRRIAGPHHSWEFAPKRRGLPGLELADMVARPIGLGVIRPDQPNRALECIKGRLRLLIQ